MIPGTGAGGKIPTFGLRWNPCPGNAARYAQCPEIKPETKEDALRQSLNWYVAASIAARRDLAPLFCDRWKLPLSAGARRAAGKVPWASPALTVAAALAGIPADFAPEPR